MHHFEDPLFKAIFNQLSEPRLIIRFTKESFVLVRANLSWQRFAAEDLSPLFGRELLEVLDGLSTNVEIRNLIKDMIPLASQHLETFRLPPCLITLPDQDEDFLWCQAECTPIIYEDTEHIRYLICTLHDVTSEIVKGNELKESRRHEASLLAEQHVLNAKLSKSNKELQELNAALTESQRSLFSINLQLEARVLERTYALTESENRFRSLFEQAPIGMCILSGSNLDVELVNDPMLKIWNRNREEVLKQPFEHAVPQLRGQQMLDSIREAFDQGETRVNNELNVVLNTDNYLREIYVNSIYHPLKDERGNVRALMIILSDITEWVVARQQTEGVREQLNLALESAELGTWYLDLQTGEFIVSARLRSVLGYDSESPVNLDRCLDLIEEGYRNNVRIAMQSAISEYSKYEIEYPLRTENSGELKWIRATGKVFGRKKGRATHFSGTVLDITGRKLEEIRKNDFIAIISHELKTPLTSLKSYLQVMGMKQKHKDSFFANAVARSLTQVERMHSMIRGFLDVTRLESGRLQLEKQYFNIHELMMDLAEETTLFAEDHHVVVESCSRELLIYADRDKIGQVLSNMLSNAVKYSSKGKRITMSCKRTDSEVILSVKDEGIGVHSSDQDKLFDRYYRVESKQTKTISGFGIGLYLCAELVKLHNGNIGLNSQVGKGTTFYFTLPVE